jgi:hypothetical protein
MRCSELSIATAQSILTRDDTGFERLFSISNFMQMMTADDRLFGIAYRTLLAHFVFL